MNDLVKMSLLFKRYESFRKNKFFFKISDYGKLMNDILNEN